MIQQAPLGNVIDRSLNYGRHLMSDFLTAASPKGVKVVLDIGAGRGDDLLLARVHNPTAQLHAIEVYPEYENVLKHHGITVHPLNIERDRFPFPDGSVDVVMANQILEHVKEIFWVFHEASRVLRVGGSLIIGVPNLASLHNRILLAIGKQPTSIQNHTAHVRGYTRSDLLNILNSCFPKGYALRRFGGSNFYPFPPVVAKPLASLFPNMAVGIFLMFQKERAYSDEFIHYPVEQRLETNFHVGAEHPASLQTPGTIA